MIPDGKRPTLVKLKALIAAGFQSIRKTDRNRALLVADHLTALGAEPVVAPPSLAVSPAALPVVAPPDVSPPASPAPPVRRSRRQRDPVSYAEAGAEIDDDDD